MPPRRGLVSDASGADKTSACDMCQNLTSRSRSRGSLVAPFAPAVHPLPPNDRNEATSR